MLRVKCLRNVLFNSDTSLSIPSLSLRNVVSSPFTFFLRLPQPKAQHCVPNFPIFLTAYNNYVAKVVTPIWRRLNFAGFIFRLSRPSFFAPRDIWVARSSPIFQISVWDRRRRVVTSPTMNFIATRKITGMAKPTSAKLTGALSQVPGTAQKRWSEGTPSFANINRGGWRWAGRCDTSPRMEMMRPIP